MRSNKFVIYRSAANGLWYWSMVAPNGKVIADSAESYATKSSCKRAIKAVLSRSWVVVENI